MLQTEKIYYYIFIRGIEFLFFLLLDLSIEEFLKNIAIWNSLFNQSILYFLVALTTGIYTLYFPNWEYSCTQFNLIDILYFFSFNFLCQIYEFRYLFYFL
jgi:hypothetical protein